MLGHEYSRQIFWYFIVATLVFVILFLFVPYPAGRAVVKALSGTFIASAIAMIIFSWSMRPIHFWILYFLNAAFFLGITTLFMVNLAPPDIEFSRILRAVWVDAVPYFKATFLLCVGLSGLKYYFGKRDLEKTNEGNS